MSTSNVLDVARYMIDVAEKDNKPLSNLKLQKILYFLWKRYYREKRDCLFDNDYFYAWKFGPVVPSVYYEYFMFGAYPISSGLLDSFNKDVLSAEVRRIIETTVKEYENRSVAELVNQTHVVNGAWDRIFANGKGIKEIIPFTEIIEDIHNES